MKLHLGVNEIAYSDPEEHQATTTGQVAEILEEKYHVMDVFWDRYRDEIEDLVCDRLIDELESITHGKPVVPLKGMPFPKIDRKFSTFLDRDEWQQTTGKKIMAAQLGISHRFKNAQNKTVSASAISKGASTKGLKKILTVARGPRPAFIDTGLYQKSFTAWLE